ncbi:hypothetical protein HCH54_007305 [Aspergillus fumigatus]
MELRLLLIWLNTPDHRPTVHRRPDYQLSGHNFERRWRCGPKHPRLLMLCISVSGVKTRQHFIEMQKQTTDEACDIFDELFVEGQTYQLSQTDKFSSFNHAH